MKKLSIVFGIFGLFAILALMAAPAFPISVHFDFNGDEVWDTEWSMSQGETVAVDVWLDDYNSDWTVTSILYTFTWNAAFIEITDAWPYDTDNGGDWDPAKSYANLYNDNQYWYKVGSESVTTPGITVDGKIKLHTIVLKSIVEGESEIKTKEGENLPMSSEIFTFLNGQTGDASIGTYVPATILGPFNCDLTIIPKTANVFTWETLQFATTVNGSCPEPDPSCYTWEISAQQSTGSISATGLYTAGENEGTDTIKVTDTCNGNITDTAEVSVSSSTTTTTSMPGPGPGPTPTPTTTTSVIPEGGSCITDKSCNDGVFCNGEERCDYGGQKTGAYSWSAGLAGSTGDAGNTGNELGICRRGDVPCPDDGLYCTGEISCDEEKEICSSTGDPCEPEGLICDEASNICRPPECVDDEDCDDRLFCNGEETCVDGTCREGEDPCPDEECDEEKNMCTPDVPPVPPLITVSPDPLLRSRWIMLPTLLAISGEETDFSQLTSRVSYSPSTAMLSLPALVMSKEFIWQMVFVNPSWLAGFPGDMQTVTATVDGLSDAFEIKLLPFILDQKHRPK